jgi:hypothetical protein
MLRGLYRLLAPPSAHTICYYHRTNARVINYWHQGRRRAHSARPPDHPRRKHEENRSITARMPYGIWFPVGFAQKQTGLLEKACAKWPLPW